MERSGQIQYLHSHRNTAGSDRNRGYSLTELMLALTVLVFLSGITVPLISTLVKVRKSSEVFYQDEIGLYQLQLELALHDIEEVNYESIVYHKNGDTFILHIVNDKLLSQPGSEDFIHGISEAFFEVEDSVIYLSFSRQGKQLRFPIGYYEEQ